MSPVDTRGFVAVSAALIAVACITVVLGRRRRVPVGYHARLAWLRGCAFTATVVAVVTATDAFGQAEFLPATSTQWRVGGALVTVVIGLYAGIWSRGTSTFGRPPAVAASLTFGVVWGTGAAGVVVIAWWLSGMVTDAAPPRAVLAFLMVATWQGIWHDRYWDRFVSPEHNLPEWNLRKVALVHTPNLMGSFAYLAWADAVAPVVAAQLAAIVVSALVMRFPAPSVAPVTPSEGAVA